MGAHGVQKRGRVEARMDHGAVRRVQEPVLDGAVEEGEQLAEVTGNVEQANWLVVEAELGPCKGLKQFVESAKAAWQSEERIRELVHESLPVMHGLDDVLLGEPGMGDLLIHQGAGNHTNHDAAGFQCRISKSAHEPDTGPAVHQTEAAAGDFGAGAAGSIEIGFQSAGGGATEDANGLHGI